MNKTKILSETIVGTIVLLLTGIILHVSGCKKRQSDPEKRAELIQSAKVDSLKKIELKKLDSIYRHELNTKFDSTARDSIFQNFGTK